LIILLIILFDENARMAELVDASDSKSGYRKVVQVRFLFRALIISFLRARFGGPFCFCPNKRPTSLKRGE
jgi:hypothetical protein